MTQNLLAYSVRPSVIIKYFGNLGVALGIMAAVPMIAALLLRDWNLSLYYLSIASLSFLFGWRLSKTPKAGNLKPNEILTIICLSFFLGSAIAMLPFMAEGLTFTNALFEAISGITTTGLTMISLADNLSATTFFNRAWLQWTGGLGIMVFSLAILPRQGIILKMPRELQPDNEDLIGSTKHHAQIILYVYCFFTLAGIFGMLLSGSGLYDAILLVLSSVSTGGFSPFPDSIASLDRIQQIGLTCLALLCAVSLPLYYNLFKHRILMKQQGIQALGILFFCFLVSMTLGGTIDSWILGISAQTTTGFSSTDIASLGNGQKLILSFSMLIGGSIGSTAGGFKILRLLLFFIAVKTLIIRINQTSHAIYTPKLFGISFSDRQFELATILISLYTLTVCSSWLCFVSMGYPAVDALFEVSSALGTVGLSTGITSAELPVFLKAVLGIDMLLGRLEIFPWLVVLYPPTWLGQRLEEE